MDTNEYGCIKYTKSEVIRFKVQQLNKLKNMARYRAYNNERLLDKLEIRDFMKGQIYDGHIIEIVAFSILGNFQKYIDHKFIVLSSEYLDKKMNIDAIIINEEEQYKIDFKSSYSYQANRYAGSNNAVVLNYDDSGAKNLFIILDYINISELELRKKLGRDSYLKLIAESNSIWEFYMKEFNLI